MNKLKYIFSVIIISFSFQAMYSQNNEKKEIEILFDKLFFASTDSIKNKINEKILFRLEKYLQVKHNFIEDFKDVKNLKALRSDDKDVFLFTWSVKYDDGSFKYLGFIRYYNNNTGKYQLIQLIDNEEIDKSFYDNKVQVEEWYGAVYYKIISKKYKRKRTYLLLGWDANDDFTNKKIIDILYVDEDDEVPVFGKNIIDYNGRKLSRIVFEYAQRIAMVLTYDSKKDMIIWDHLSPSNPKFRGNFKYYGPDFSFDALQFKKGEWKYIEDVILN